MWRVKRMEGDDVQRRVNAMRKEDLRPVRRFRLFRKSKIKKPPGRQVLRHSRMICETTCGSWSRRRLTHETVEKALEGKGRPEPVPSTKWRRGCLSSGVGVLKHEGLLSSPTACRGEPSSAVNSLAQQPLKKDALPTAEFQMGPSGCNWRRSDKAS